MAANRKEITIAALSLIGVLGAALFTNWDKIWPASQVGPTDPKGSLSIQGNNNIQVDSGSVVVNNVPPPKPCRDKSHGIERYARELDVERWSNWMGGGYSQEPWCNDVINSLRGEHPEGEFSVAKMDERSESKCKPLNCPQYKYYCKVHIKTEPIYIERLSSARK